MTKKQKKQTKPRQFTGVPKGRPPKVFKDKDKKRQQDQHQRQLDSDIFPPEQSFERNSQPNQQIQSEQDNDFFRQKENQEQIQILIICYFIDFFAEINQKDNGNERNKNNFAKGHVFSSHDQSTKGKKAKCVTRDKLIKESLHIQWAEKEDWIQEQEIKKIDSILESNEFARIREANQQQLYKKICLKCSSISCSEASKQIYFIIARLWISSINKDDDIEVFAEEIFRNNNKRFPFYSYNFSEYYKPDLGKLRQALGNLCKNIYELLKGIANKATSLHQEMISNEKV